ncbi:hypothetical protein D3C78_1840610 [compost metagenome]
MRIHHHRIRLGDRPKRPSRRFAEVAIGQQPIEAPVGGIDVQAEPSRLAHLDQAVDGIHGPEAGRPGSGHHRPDGMLLEQAFEVSQVHAA